jgi:hypothetical protein
MPEVETRAGGEAERTQAAAAFTKADLTCAFGPSFFMGHLGRFVRDRCPDPTENLPMVKVRLVDGETLDVCHIIGVSPRWVMFAVRDAASHGDEMALALVPYETIQRIGISIRRAEGSSIGFSQPHPPEIITPETLLAAMAPPSSPAAGGAEEAPS